MATARTLWSIAAAAAACRSAGPDTGAPPPRRDAGGSGAPVDAAPAAAPATPNAFFAAGTPTFILGTAGDDRADRAIATQVALIRDAAFPTAPTVTDAEVGATWPEHPVVYGGAHVNALVARLAPCLAFSIDAGHLAIGGTVYDRDDLALVTVVPARPADASCPGHPTFLLYAGTGTPGIEEINAGSVTRGGEPLVIADALGRLRGGTYRGGAIALDAEAQRLAYRGITRTVRGVTVELLAVGRPVPEAIAAVDRGVATAVDRLGLTGAGLALRVYLHADRAAKERATGNPGDGHAVAFARALHLRADAPGAALVSLVAHEGTHALLPERWGGAGTPLMGEGVAVWVAGQYGGRSLAAWNDALAAGRPSAELLTQLRALPEREAYPLAGLFVEAAIGAVGLAGVRDHLYGASPSGWAAACRAAGTTAEALEAAYQALLAR